MSPRVESPSPKVLETDVLVIGAGLAGGIAALKLAELGRRVLLVSGKGSASSWAQGGIVYRGPHDPTSLEHDIWEAGCHRNFKPVVKIVAEEGPKAIDEWLCKRLNVSFDESSNGVFDLALEAAHESHRILHVKDSTGAAITEGLEAALLKESRMTRTSGRIIDLMVSDRHDERREMQFAPSVVCGAYVYQADSGSVVAVKAQAVILATGGFSQLYQHSTGPGSSRGDGISAGHRAGARTLDLEYVQFHPTALYLPGKPRRLLTEALRGAGATLKNLDEKTFVDELAPRDVVARAIHEEMLRSGGSHVWLDLRTIPELENKFPSMVKLIREEGFDPRQDLIPVVPAAHYTIGGIWTDERGATSLPGLYAAGEVACTGLHGANRLASTSLLEALVFGQRAAEAASQYAAAHPVRDFKPRAWNHEKLPVDPALLAQDWQLLRQTLWNYVGLVRSERRLRRAERILVELRTEVESFYKKSQLSEELIGLRNGVLVATLVLYSALRNRESVGTHYLKQDY